jgi:hypothetical protein
MRGKANCRKIVMPGPGTQNGEQPRCQYQCEDLKPRLEVIAAEAKKIVKWQPALRSSQL